MALHLRRADTVNLVCRSQSSNRHGLLIARSQLLNKDTAILLVSIQDQTD